MSAASTADAAERPLPLRMRPDLRVSPQWYRGRRHWLLKDPLSLHYFHLLDEEYALLQMLDGQTSLAELRQRFEQRFAPRRLRLSPLQTFLSELHRRGLVLSDVPQQSEPLLARHAAGRRRAWAERFGNLLAIRLPGLDPTPLLQRLTPLCRWCFSRGALTVWWLLTAGAALLVAVHCQVLLQRLPDFRSFFHGGNLLALALTLAGVKVLHELAHAVACRHFGGECHELGLMLLLFTPCLYCNVSDAWTLPNKWHRIVISAAGIYVELFVAAIGTFLWWFSEPGWLNSLCLNAMFVCSVSTLLFNGNPLLRFDGYYVLTDWLEIPNLQARAQATGSRLFARWCLGVDLASERAFTEGDTALLAGYAVASAVYRLVVVIGTFLFLHAVLKPYHLELVAQVFMGLVLLGMALGPAWQWSRFWMNPLMQQQIHRRRLIASLGSLAVAVAAVGFCPLPHRVSAPALVQPEAAHYVYIAVPGVLREAVPAGRHVEPGTVLARLSDPEIDRQVAKLTNERNLQQLQVRQLEARRGQHADVAVQLPSAQKLLAELESGLAQVQRRANQLTVAAPASGVVIAPPRLTTRPQAPGRLVAWSGTPLDATNRGSYLDAGTLLCLVGDPRRLQAVAMIDQADLEFVQPGQRVLLRLNQRPGRTLGGTVEELAQIDLEAEPRQLAAVGGLPARVDAYGVSRPLATTYQARISLDEHDEQFLAGAPGQCRITVAPRSLGQRLGRYLSGTFRFNL